MGQSTNETQLMLLLTAAHNDDVYECEAANSASESLGVKLVSAVKLRVAFGPEMKPAIEGNQAVTKGDSLTLICASRDPGNPPPKIVWLLDGKEVSSDNAVTKESSGDDGGVIVKQNITLTDMQAEHNGKTIECKVVNEVSNVTQVQKAQLEVQYGPGDVRLEGPADDITYLVEGKAYNFTCNVGSEGNPASNVSISKKLTGAFSETVKGPEVTPLMVYEVNSTSRDLHGAELVCNANNGIEMQANSSVLGLQVAFGPDKVEMFGKTEVDDGENVTILCVLSQSNPIEITINGAIINETDVESETFQHNASITKSLKASQPYTPHTVLCQGRNPVTNKSVSKTHIINVRHAPGMPTISVEDWNIHGKNATIQCSIPSKGYPDANTSIFLDGQEIKDQSLNDERATATVLAMADMNGKEIKCVVDNGVGGAKEAKADMVVAFDAAKMTIDGPESGDENTNVTVTCFAHHFYPNASDFEWDIPSEFTAYKQPGVLTKVDTADGKSFNLSQSVIVTLSRKNYQNQMVSCSLTNSITGAKKSTTKHRLDTHFPPKNVKISPTDLAFR